MATPAASNRNSRAPPTISPPTMAANATAFPHGQRAKEMLANLKKSGAVFLPPYDEEGVRAVLEECKRLTEMVNELVEQEQRDHREAEVAVTLSTYHQSIARNKRCVLAYLSYRLERIESLWWRTASPVVPPEYASNLSQAELDHYSKFQDLTTKAASEVELDITSHMQPPRELYVQVRVIKDAGVLLLQSGAQVILEKNSTHYLRRSDVEHLIRQNVLEQA